MKKQNHLRSVAHGMLWSLIIRTSESCICAPLKELQRKFGFEPDQVVTAAKELLGSK